MLNRVKKKIGAGEYRRIRAGLIRRGSNLARWAFVNGYKYTTVVMAARGERAGARSREIISKLMEDLK